jgi:hypothetical protein
MQTMIFIGNSLTVLVTNAEAGAGQSPINGPFFTDDPATAALEASLEGKHQITIDHVETSRRAAIEAPTVGA